MKTTDYLRKTTTVVSSAALLLALAGSAFALGGGNTPVTNLQGVTITSAVDGSGTYYTINMNASAGFSYAGGTGTIASINGLFISSSPQVTTTGTLPYGFKATSLTGGNNNVGGATGYDTSFSSKGSPILPGVANSDKFYFNTTAPTGATFLLDISQGQNGSGPFNPTGRISFTRPLSPPPTTTVPEPGSIATLSLGSLGLLCMVLTARRHRNANNMV